MLNCLIAIKVGHWDGSFWYNWNLYCHIIIKIGITDVFARENVHIFMCILLRIFVAIACFLPHKDQSDEFQNNSIDWIEIRWCTNIGYIVMNTSIVNIRIFAWYSDHFCRTSTIWMMIGRQKYFNERFMPSAIWINSFIDHNWAAPNS